jgi:tetratricopeptide (TPR) repeat protein
VISFCRIFICQVVLFAAVIPGSYASTVDLEIHDAVQLIKDEWAHIFYELPADMQPYELAALLPRAEALVRRYPYAAEPLLMEALVLCALAGAEGGFAALGKVRQARDLIERAISIEPLAMQGSGYVMLGNLYYRLPGWPLSFGDDDRARRYLETALKYFPDTLDTNYFYGEFLLEQGDFTRALTYLEKAEMAPVRSDSRLSDLQLKKELTQDVKDAKEKNTHRLNFFNRFLSTIK